MPPRLRVVPSAHPKTAPAQTASPRSAWPWLAVTSGAAALVYGSDRGLVHERAERLARQIVDDLTDFEFDVRRKSHNLLVSQIHHLGSQPERAAAELATLSAGFRAEHAELVEGRPAVSRAAGAR